MVIEDLTKFFGLQCQNLYTIHTILSLITVLFVGTSLLQSIHL